ncbi:MAG: hypothetical protein WEA36_07170 [Balneolaceae bacterium]
MARVDQIFGFRMVLLLLLTVGVYPTLSAQALPDVPELPGVPGEPVVPILPGDGDMQFIISHPFDVRSISLGSATLSDRWNLSPMGVNASLLALREPDLAVQFNSAHYWSDNRMISSVTLPTLSAGSHRISGRFGASHQSTNQFNYLETPSLPEFDLQVYLADVAYAYRFSNAFSMGVLNRFTHIENEERELVTYTVDLGLVYAPQGKITYALIARGMGRHGMYGSDSTGKMLLRSSSQEASIELGATINYPIQSRPILSISFSNEKRLYEDGIWYKGGVEVLPFPMIALRSGLQFHLEQSLAIPRFGTGIHLGWFHLDYMVSPYVRTGEQYHQLGVTLEF